MNQELGRRQSLTEGLADPGTIERQRKSYSQMVDEQYHHALSSLDTQIQQALNGLHSQMKIAENENALQTDMEFDRQAMSIDALYHEQSFQLQAQAAQQRSELDQQAMQLVFDYKEKETASKLQMNEYNLAKLQADTENQVDILQRRASSSSIQ
eukprot:GEMP01032360.1.p1 GENE.GEMP01032360.1~~GEMP01032360.1.p1  ORF type:complete len:154 (+),score=30.79 GEMP01032360.1:91-552(+)